MNRTLALAAALGGALLAAGAPARGADAPLPAFTVVPPPSAPLPAFTAVPPPSAPLPAFMAVPPPSALLPAAGGASAALAAPLAEPESIYHGLYVGTEVFGVGGHGIKGGFGGDVYAGYERLLGNGVLLDVQGAAGHGPAIWGGPGLKGWNFGEASAAVGYPMGRITPFVTAGLVVARPVLGGIAATDPTGGINDLMNGGGSLYAAPRVGAGFTYALTPNTAVSFDVQVGRGLAAGLP